MRKLPTALLALIGGIALTAATAVAQDSGPLVDLLVKKGLINDQEAEELRADLAKDFAGTSAGKLSLAPQITEFKLGGDLRLRHQIETKRAQGATTWADQTRERYRFRLNGDFQMQKGWSAGFALETGSAADSANETFTNANNDYNIFLARAYVGWQPRNDLKFVVGKQRNPLYTTDLVWDADINPQGAAEIYTYSLGGSDTLEFRALQSIMFDNKESVVGPKGNDSWLFAQQAVYSKALGKAKLVIAPGYMVYSHSYLGDLPAGSNETQFSGPTNGLSLVTFAGEVAFADVGRAGDGVKLYWDSSYNLEANRRVHQVYGLTTASKDAAAWLVGIGYNHGTGKLAGDYGVKLDYRSIGIGALDPNISDSDFGFGNLNQSGFKLAGSYNLTDFSSLNLNYFYTSDIRGTLTHAVATLDASRILQLDLVVKF